MSRTGPRVGVARPLLVLAAAALLGLAASLIQGPERPNGRFVPEGLACRVAGATQLRLLVSPPKDDGLGVLGELPVRGSARVPAGTRVLVQALGADGMALWTSPRWTRVPPAPAGAGPALCLDPTKARLVRYGRDVKPILDRHCAGCHAEEDLVRSARPFDARRSPLVTETHGGLTDAERRELALWVDSGAARP